MQKAVRHYADLRTARGQKAAQEAWETPVVEARVRSVSASAKRQTRHDRKRRPSRTRPNGGMAVGGVRDFSMRTRQCLTGRGGCFGGARGGGAAVALSKRAHRRPPPLPFLGPRAT